MEHEYNSVHNSHLPVEMGKDETCMEMNNIQNSESLLDKIYQDSERICEDYLKDSLPNY